MNHVLFLFSGFGPRERLHGGYFSGMQMDFERIAAKQRLQKELDKIVPVKAVSA